MGHHVLSGASAGRPARRAVAIACGALLAGGAAWAQAPASSAPQALPEVTVSAPGGEQTLFDIAGSADRVEGADLRADRLGAQISEGLEAVPGLLIQDRHNYAQDLQLSIRGFGSRSTFGVRGVRIYVDGIPATLPDGQGQTSNIDIGSIDHIDVLRGPFSALYGNSSGGVVQIFTEDGSGPPKVEVSSAGGSWGTSRTGAKVSGSSGRVSYLVSGSHFHTHGWRQHSSADRDVLNTKVGLDLGGGDKLTLIGNYVNVPAQDPGGLSADQVRANPRQAPTAINFDTRKDVDQTQFGLTYLGHFGSASTLRLTAYGGHRNTLQFLAIPLAPQRNPTHSGGVVDLGRDYVGMDARWTTRTELAARPFEIVGGLAWDNLREKRRGFENWVGPESAPIYGQIGSLRRDERNKVWNLDPYAQARWQLAERWRLEAGVRHSSVHFRSRDRYIVGANGDDSYGARFNKWLPTAALRFQATRDLAFYGAVGRGFETPTLNELAYRAGDTGGINTTLGPASNTSYELGAKARLAGGWLTAAVFQTNTQGEIVTLASSGGRTTFQNAGRTRRRGLELSWDQETRNHWRTQLAYTYLNASYRDSFCAPAPCDAADQVRAGNRLPGIPRHALYASFGWMPPQGFHAGAEVRVISRMYADDSNSASAPGYATTALHAGYTRAIGRWELNGFARVDNVFNRRTIGSLIVNDTNGRYFEPAPGRTWLVGATARYRF